MLFGAGAASLELAPALIEERVADAFDLPLPVLTVVDRGDTPLPLPRHELHARDLLAHRLDITFVERADLAAVGVDREDEEHVRTERADLLLDIRRHPLAQRDHGDHRGDADDDAERREEAAQDVAPYLAQSEQQEIGRAHV